jgi:hypothetical protein
MVNEDEKASSLFADLTTAGIDVVRFPGKVTAGNSSPENKSASSIN